MSGILEKSSLYYPNLKDKNISWTGSGYLVQPCFFKKDSTVRISLKSDVVLEDKPGAIIIFTDNIYEIIVFQKMVSFAGGIYELVNIKRGTIGSHRMFHQAGATLWISYSQIFNHFFEDIEYIKKLLSTLLRDKYDKRRS